MLFTILKDSQRRKEFDRYFSNLVSENDNRGQITKDNHLKIFRLDEIALESSWVSRGRTDSVPFEIKRRLYKISRNREVTPNVERRENVYLLPCECSVIERKEKVLRAKKEKEYRYNYIFNSRLVRRKKNA